MNARSTTAKNFERKNSRLNLQSNVTIFFKRRSQEKNLNQNGSKEEGSQEACKEGYEEGSQEDDEEGKEIISSR